MSDTTPTITDLIDARMTLALADVHTSLPCRVVKYYPERQCVDAQPLLKQEYSNGWVAELPVIQGLPVVFQGASNSLISFPLNSGDIVLAIFSERSLDKWVNSTGKPVNPNTGQMHDLSDAFVIPGLHTHRTHNQPDPDNLEVRFNVNTANKTSIKMKQDGSVDVNAPLNINVTTPVVNYSGNLDISGNVTVDGTVAAQGTVSSSTDVTSNGTGFNTHTHGGVQTGGGNTGAPN